MKYRVTMIMEVKLDVDGEEELVTMIDKAIHMPEVRRVTKVQRLITEELVDGVVARG